MHVSEIVIGKKYDIKPGFSGLRAPITVTVTNKEDDIKNGKPGIDYETEDGKLGWCYVEQIIGPSK